MWLKVLLAALSRSGKAVPIRTAQCSGQERTRSLVRMAGALAVGALTLAGTMTPAAALESKSVLDGMAACNTWCENHNPPGNSRNACLNQCRKYWYCNGSDALKYVLNCKFYKTGSATIQTNPQTTPQSRPKLPLSTTPLAPAQ